MEREFAMGVIVPGRDREHHGLVEAGRPASSSPSSEIAYRTTTAYAADARDAGNSWTHFAPFPMQVVASSTVDDGMGARYVAEYEYRDAYYDGWEAEFRGFGEAKAVLQDVASFEETQETMALLKILALGNREIELGKFRDAEEVFAGLDKADLQ